MTRLVVFDCDGTLIDSQANIFRAMATAFAKSRLDAPPNAAVRRIVGLSLIEAVAELLPEGETRLHGVIAADYKRAFAARGVTPTGPRARVPSSLELIALRRRVLAERSA